MWGRYDPKATQFVHIDEMPDLLHTLPKPFKVPKPNEIKIAALQLPVMEGGRIHCLDVLYALTKRLLGEIEVRNFQIYFNSHSRGTRYCVRWRVVYVITV